MERLLKGKRPVKDAVDVIFYKPYDNKSFCNAMTGKENTDITKVVRKHNTAFINHDITNRVFCGYSLEYDEKYDCLIISTYKLFYLSNNKPATWVEKSRAILTRDMEIKKHFRGWIMEGIDDESIDILNGKSKSEAEKFFKTNCFWVQPDVASHFGRISCFKNYINDILANNSEKYSLGMIEIGKTNPITPKPIPPLFYRRLKQIISQQQKVKNNIFDKCTFLSLPSNDCPFALANDRVGMIENHGDTSIVRIFLVSMTKLTAKINDEDINLVEIYRWYVNKESIEAMKHNNCKLYEFNEMLLYYEKEGLDKTPMGWVESALKNNNNRTKKALDSNKLPEKKYLNKICFMLLNPMVEKLYKSPYRELSNYILTYLEDHHLYTAFPENNDNIFDDLLRDALGDIDIKQKKLHKFIQCPEFLLQKSINKGREYSSILIIAKKIFKTVPEYFIRMNQKDILDLILIIRKMIEIGRGFTETAALTMSKLIDIYGPKNFRGYYEYCYKNYMQNDLRTYEDYVVRLHALKDTTREFEWKLTGADLILSYNSIFEAYMMVSDKTIFKKYLDGFEARKEELAKYEFSGEEFSVIAPKKPSDLVIEGSELNHCVKTFMEAVANGDTTILFIRKNSNLKKPFFTLEIKSGGVRQCHGANNSKLREPKLTKFVKEYCQTNNIQWNNPDSALAV